MVQIILSLLWISHEKVFHPFGNHPLPRHSFRITSNPGTSQRTTGLGRALFPVGGHLLRSGFYAQQHCSFHLNLDFLDLGRLRILQRNTSARRRASQHITFNMTAYTRPPAEKLWSIELEDSDSYHLLSA